MLFFWFYLIYYNIVFKLSLLARHFLEKLTHSHNSNFIVSHLYVSSRSWVLTSLLSALHVSMWHI